jgi:DNA-binding protein HU-beta
MRQKELIDLAMQTMGLNRDQASKALEGALHTLARAIKEGDGKVPLAGIGTFNVKETKARKGRNPRTGEEIDIPSRKKVSFKASGELMVALNGDASDDEEESD